MLLVATHHTITPTECGPNTEPKGWVVTRGGILPFWKWFDTQDHDALSSIKESFFSSERKRPIELFPTFEAFRPWLKEIRGKFARGFNCKNQDSTADEELIWGEKQAGKSANDATSAPVPFDDEALDERADYSTVIEPTRRFEGELKGLIIRYDTKAGGGGGGRSGLPGSTLSTHHAHPSCIRLLADQCTYLK